MVKYLSMLYNSKSYINCLKFEQLKKCTLTKNERRQNMKKQFITFGLGVIVGVIATLFVLIMRSPANEMNLAEETAYVQETTQSPKNIPDTDAYLDEEDISDNEISNTEDQETDSIQLKDKNGKFNPEALELAQKYCDLYNNGKWDGASKIDSVTGIEVSNDWGIIALNSKKTSIRTDERIICDNAVKSYMSGKWDGRKKKIKGGHTIELSVGDGYLLLDGYQTDITENLDIPKKVYKTLYNGINIYDYEYVPGKGTYFIVDKKLVKYLRGKKITLPGEKLSWKGFQNRKDVENQISDEDSSIMYDKPLLTYDTKDKKLYLLTGDKKHGSLLDRKQYVYVFNDIARSEIEYMGMVDYDKYAFQHLSIKEMTSKK